MTTFPKWFALVYFIPFAVTLATAIGSYEIDCRAATQQETTTGRIIGWSWNHQRVLHYAFEVKGVPFRDGGGPYYPLRGNAHVTVYYERNYPCRNSTVPFAKLAENDLRGAAIALPITFLMGVVVAAAFLRWRPSWPFRKPSWTA